MYYKVTNNKSQVYKDLFAMRTKEYKMQEDNYNAVVKKSGSTFTTFLGGSGQQNFRRVRQYCGFLFEQPEKLDMTAWKKDKVHPEIFIPNRRTKSGREMNEFLLNGLKGNLYTNVFDILSITEHFRKFTLPYVEIFGKQILVFLGNDVEPKDKNLIEITKKEFEAIIEKENNKTK
jgi:hypothetical protein